MKFRIIGSIVIVLLAIVLYAIFGGSSEQSNTTIEEPSVSLPQ